MNTDHPIEIASALARPQNLYAYVGGDLPRVDVVATMLELATDAIAEEGFSEWLRAHVVPRG